MTHRRPSPFRSLSLSLLAALLVTACTAGPPQPTVEPADLVLRGGKIVTMGEARPEVEALAARGGEVVALGTAAEIEPLVGPETQVIELAGRLAIPGFIEGHGHFLGIGQARMQLDLRQTGSWDEVIAMVAAAVEQAEPGQWIEGRGWHQDKWDRVPQPSVQGLPVHDSLSAVSPENPVVLRHASGHSSFANARAMSLAGIGADTVAPPGGEIVRDERGNAIGHFRETAMSLVDRREPPSEGEMRRMVELATEECLAKGITSFQDAGSPLEVVELLRTLADEQALRLRLWVMIRDRNERIAAALPAVRRVGYGDEHLTVRAIKHSVDGALGSHGAWLLAPYEDLPESTGLNTTPLDVIEKTAEIALANDLQVCVHAIGDRGNREILDLYQRAFETHPDKNDLRWRIEHAQHLALEDIPRFGQLGVIASMQAVHCTSDGPWVPTRLGDQRSEEGAYVWRKLLETGAVVTNGTDAPVEDVSPIASYYSAVSRMMRTGERFYPDQRMNRLEALRSYTLNNAYAAFEEDRKGSLELGKLADVTVLSQDVLSVPEEQIPETKVVYTIVGGEVQFAADDQLIETSTPMH